MRILIHIIILLVMITLGSTAIALAYINPDSTTDLGVSIMYGMGVASFVVSIVLVMLMRRDFSMKFYRKKEDKERIFSILPVLVGYGEARYSNVEDGEVTFGWLFWFWCLKQREERD